MSHYSEPIHVTKSTSTYGRPNIHWQEDFYNHDSAIRSPIYIKLYRRHCSNDSPYGNVLANKRTFVPKITAFQNADEATRNQPSAAGKYWQQILANSQKLSLLISRFWLFHHPSKFTMIHQVVIWCIMVNLSHLSAAQLCLSPSSSPPQCPSQSPYQCVCIHNSMPLSVCLFPTIFIRERLETNFRRGRFRVVVLHLVAFYLIIFMICKSSTFSLA